MSSKLHISCEWGDLVQVLGSLPTPSNWSVSQLAPCEPLPVFWTHGRRRRGGASLGIEGRQVSYSQVNAVFTNVYMSIILDYTHANILYVLVKLLA